MQKKYSTMIAVTVVFALALAGIERVQPYVYAMNPVWFYACEVLIYLCILGATRVGVVPGLVISAVAPVAMIAFGDAAILPALVLIVANVLVVLCRLVLKGKRLLGLLAGVAARFAFAYVLTYFVLAKMLGSEAALGYVIVDKVNLWMPVTSLIAALFYFAVDALSAKSSGSRPEQAAAVVAAQDVGADEEEEGAGDADAHMD